MNIPAEDLREIAGELQNEAKAVFQQCRRLRANGNLEGAEFLALNAGLLMSLAKVCGNLAADKIQIVSHLPHNPSSS